MASNTKKTENKRQSKARAMGKERKRGLEKQGTTQSEASLFGNTLER